MKFPDYFADAEASFDEADFIIFGAPYDKTSSFRLGASEGPKEIRQASWNFETFNIRTGVDLKDIKFHDYGDLDVKNLKPSKMVDKVEKFTNKVLKKNKFPIIIGGEHSVTPGVVKAFPKDTAVLSLDAHIDFRDSYEDEKFNHACATQRIADHVNVENVAVLGIRSAEKEEFLEAEKKDLFYISSFDIKKFGLKNALIETKNHLKNKPLYLTLDIDVLDPSFAPGTATPEPYGFSPFDIVECIDIFSKDLVGFDIVEVCPPYDQGQTALLAAKFIRYVIEKVWISKKD
jgi:agmatinase